MPAGADNGTACALTDARILVTTSRYAPECTGPAPYVTDLTQALARSGADVVVVTPRSPDAPCSSGSPRAGAPDGVRVCRIRGGRSRGPVNSPGIRRALSFLRVGMREIDDVRPDVVITCLPSLSAGVLGAVVARRAQVPYVLVIHADPLTAPCGHGSQWLSDHVHRWIVSGATSIVLSWRGAAPRPVTPALGCPVTVVPGWTSQELLAPGDPRRQEAERVLWREQLDWRGRFVVAYTGDLGPEQGLEELLPVLDGLGRTHPGVLFSLLGEGERRGYLERAARRLTNLQVLDPVPYVDHPQVLRAADVLLLHERATHPGASVPWELATYLGVGRPVLALTHPDSPAAHAVDRCGAGVVVPAGDAAALGSALTILREDPVLRERLGATGRAHCEKHLQPQVPLTRLTDLVAQVLADARNTPGHEGIRAIHLPDTQVLEPDAQVLRRDTQHD